MKEKKNIDRIFKEKFKDFNEEPNERVWGNIAARLDEKEKKRPLLIPLWLKVGGVAAVIAVIVAGLLFTNNFKPLQDEEPAVVFEKTSESEAASKKDSSDKKEAEQFSKTSEKKTKTSSKENLKGSKKSNSSLAGSTKNTASKNEHQKAQKSDLVSNRNDSGKQKATSSKRKRERENEALIPGVGKNAPGVIANNKVKVKPVPLQEKLDEKALVSEENALKQLEKEQKANKDVEEELSKETKASKFRIASFAAPVYYDNLGSGNEISQKFKNSPSSSKINLAYGLNVAYSISDKVKIRAGVRKISMSYSINNVAFSPTAIAQDIQNIKSNKNSVILRANAQQDAFAPSGDAASNNSLSAAVFTPGELNQQFGFIEVPLEIEYSLITGKFGLDLIAGASSLFLNENSIDLNYGNNTTNLGEANNINKTSFSGNLGFGLHYKLTDDFSLNLEPIFKYQLNTFENVGDVTPVNIGVYSGLSFQF